MRVIDLSVTDVAAGILGNAKSLGEVENSDRRLHVPFFRLPKAFLSDVGLRGNDLLPFSVVVLFVHGEIRVGAACSGHNDDLVRHL